LAGSVFSRFVTCQQDRQSDEKDADTGIDDKVIHVQLLFSTDSCTLDLETFERRSSVSEFRTKVGRFSPVLTLGRILMGKKLATAGHRALKIGTPATVARRASRRLRGPPSSLQTRRVDPTASIRAAQRKSGLLAADQSAFSKHCLFFTTDRGDPFGAILAPGHVTALAAGDIFER